MAETTNPTAPQKSGQGTNEIKIDGTTHNIVDVSKLGTEADAAYKAHADARQDTVLKQQNNALLNIFNGT